MKRRQFPCLAAAPISAGCGGSDGSLPASDSLLRLAERYNGTSDVGRMCEVMDATFVDGGAIVDGTFYQVVCEPTTFTFRLKTNARTITGSKFLWHNCWPEAK